MGDEVQPEKTEEVAAEQNTAEVPSAEENQTVQPDRAEDSKSSAEPNSSQKAEDNRIPYERFKETNDELKRLKTEYENLKKQVAPPEPEDPEVAKVKETLKSLGFVSKEELQALERQRSEDVELDKELSKLEAKYSGEDGRPKFKRDEIIDFYIKSGKVSSDPEALYKLKYEKELIDWHIKSATAKSKGVQSETSDGSGSTTVGTSDQDLRDAALKGDKDAYFKYLKRTAGFGK